MNILKKQCNKICKKIIALLLATFMILTSVPLYSLAEVINSTDVVQSSLYTIDENNYNNENNNNQSNLLQGTDNQESDGTSNQIIEGSNSQVTDENVSETGSESSNENLSNTSGQTTGQTTNSTGSQTEGNFTNQSSTGTTDKNEELSQTADENSSAKASSTLSSNNDLISVFSDVVSDENFKIALRWSGSANTAYNWNAEKSENRVIKLTFYYQNEVTEKAYAPGDLVVTIPGIGNLNRTNTSKATDIAADVYGATELKRDWSYKYNQSTDTYTFYNNHDIEQGATFNGSFEILWQFNSRECVNDYTQNVQAILTDGEKTVTSQNLTLNYTSLRDTFYINKTAKAITSADGLNKYVEEGKTVSNYAWVQYTFRYNVQTLNARGLQSRYFIDTLPQGCVIAKDTNVIKNEDGTVSYKIEESSVPENSVREYSVIVGYPEEYVGATINNTAYLYGTYKDETEETLLAESTIQVELERINNQTVGIIPNKYMSPDYIYKDSIEDDINFTATLYATATTNAENEGYTVAITDDLLEIYTPENEDGTKEATYHTLSDNEYKFTSITVPGTNSFTNANGFTLSEGDYTLKIYVLYTKDVQTRALDEYTLLYEGKWQTSSITQSIQEDAVAIRVEVSGLTESIRSFYISTRGVINIAENIQNSVYENPSYIINYDFTELKDKNGNSLIPEITEENYSQKRIYERDSQIYGKGLLRSNDTIRIIERQKDPGYYYAHSNIEPFEVDENVEYFTTKLSHYINVNNTYSDEITTVEVHGVTEKQELETLIETLQFTYSGLTFKNALSEDVDMQEYLKERATITAEENEISITFDFSDNPITSNNFSIGYDVDAQVNYEEYYNSTNPSYTVITYAYINNSQLRPQSTSTHNGKAMAVGRDSESILLALASHQQLIKMVKTLYSGEFVQEDAVSPMNTEYTYRLKLRNGYNTLVNTEFIDILEHAELTKVDEAYPYTTSEWYGTFKNVDTTYIQQQGLTPKVYYSNSIEPDENSWTLMENNNEGIWTTTNEVKAIKVTIQGEIVENSIIYADINMISPNDINLVDKKTYNTYTINCDAIDLYTGMQSTYMQNMPSNMVDVRLVEKEYDVIITKIDGVTGNRLSGVEFGLYDTEGNKIRSNLTDILGKTIIANLKEGTYILKEETTPDGYEKLEDYTLIIQNGNYTLKTGEEIKAEGQATQTNNKPTITFNIENNRAKGSITIYKIDEYLDKNNQQIPLQGIEFDLLNTEGTVVSTGRTDQNGNILFENLEWGKTYIIQEKQSLQGYELAVQNTYLSKSNKDKTVTVKNIRKTGAVTLTKQDEIDGTKLQGATYGLYAQNAIYDKEGNIIYEPDELIKETITDENGQATFNELTWGDYYLKETATIYGYDLSEQKYLFTIDAQTVENIVQETENEVRSKANLQLIKIDENGTFLPGAEFSLFDENGNKIVKINEQTGEEKAYITDENGQLNIQNIEWGNYYIQETKAPQGYEQIETKYTFTVNRKTFENGGKTVTSVKNEETNEKISIIKNTRKQGKVTLTKYSCDAQGNETTNILQGAIYELYSADGALIGEYTTNENGQITVENLNWDSYYFQEKQAPEGYSISDKKIAFVINSKNVDFEQTLSAYDKQESGEIKINKTIKADSIYSAHGNSTFIFKIVGKDENDEEKVTLYRTITFSNEDLVNVDENGNITKTITLSEIEPYKYEITEEENYRYEISTITPITNAQADEQNKKGIINLIQATENKGEITFENTKTNNSLLTDTGLITNSAQSEYYLIGIGATPKQQSYSIGTSITATDFTYTLYYSGGQEVQAELIDGITINGKTTYTEDLVGSYITNIEYTVDGKTYETQTVTKWVMPSDYFDYIVLSTADNTIAITGINEKYTSPEVLYIPGEYNGYKVQRVGRNEINSGSSTNKFSNIDNVVSVEIAEGVKEIGAYAFYNYNKIENINLPTTLTSIGNYAFRNCSSLTSIEIPESVTSIGNDAFRDCSSLTSIEISEGVTSIESSAFNGCSSLTSIEIPEGVTSIGSNAFNGCSSLTSIEIPESVTSIGGAAFDGCSSLTSIEIPEGVTSIGSSAFYGCSSLTSIEIPGGVTSIGSNAFNGCSSLTSIEISGGVTSIGSNAFYGCSSLTSIEIPDSITSIGGYAFYNCNNLSTINYHGTEEQFAAITIGSNNTPFTNATVNYIQ